MLRSALIRLVSAIKGDEEPDSNGEDSRFVPSLLDISVRVAHGGSDDEIEQELADIQNQAQELEAERREP